MHTIRQRYYVAREGIAYLKFILEGHEGIAWMTTIAPRYAIVEIHTTPGCASDLEIVLETLRRKVALRPLPSQNA